LKLIESHGIDQILDSLIGQLTEMLPIKNEVIWKNRFKKLFLAAIVYHDLGKINPNFRRLKWRMICLLKTNNYQFNPIIHY
jgi:hypothetical protein